MTNPPLPTAADVLAEAYAIVRAPCSAAETQRATLLFEIARELRCAADMRELRAQRAASEAEVAKRKLRAAALLPGQLVPDLASAGIVQRKPAGPYSMTFEGENAAARAARLLRENAPEMQWPDSAATFPALADQTQRLPIMWSVGDKADCRHCHTPIELCPVAIEPNAFVPDGGTAHMWRHKYTAQVACLVATMSSDADDVAHTFAEPAPR